MSRTPPTSEALAWATTAWRNRLGEDAVFLDRDLLKPAQTATFPTRAKVPVVIKPRDRWEVAAALRIATAHAVPIHPVSAGLNWGYGSRVPPTNGACLLDLSRLDRIERVDATLGTITVQPGVTFGAVAERLRGSGWMLPAPGVSPHASVIGSTVDGGVADGLVPLRRRAVLECEVVLPDGEIVATTGAGATPDATARGAWPVGPGPDLTGLFIQSNLGVVTRMTIALQRVPPASAGITIGLLDPGRLPTLLDVLRILRRDGRIEASVGLYNDVRLFTLASAYPYAETDGATPLPEARRYVLRQQLAAGHAWVGEVAVRATSDAHLAQARDAVLGVLGRYTDTHAVAGSSAMFHPASDTSLRSVYWRKRRTPADDLHPDRDAVGLLWCAPALPLIGSAVVACVNAFEDILIAHGLEPSLSIRVMDERSAMVLAGLHWDREVDGEDDQAMACHAALQEASARHGWVPYRTGLMGHGLRVDPGTAALMKRLKAAVDPADILSPGRYDLRDAWPEE